MVNIGILNWLRLIKRLYIYKDFRRVKFEYYNFIDSFESIDDNMLMTQICYFTHHLEKSIKHNRKQDSKRGKDKRDKLSLLLKEYQKRNLTEDKIINWVKETCNYFDTNCELYINNNIDTIKFSQEEIVNFIKNRTSSRFWIQKDVSIEVVEKIIELAYSAPTSCNRQEVRFLVKYNDIENINIGNSSNKSMFEKAPVVIYVVADERFFPEKYACALDVGSICQTLLLSMEAFGLRGTWIHEYTPDFQKEIKKKYKLKDYQHVYSSIVFGYPIDFTKKPPRLSVNFITKVVND
jgi:nitroreductase